MKPQDQASDAQGSLRPSLVFAPALSALITDYADRLRSGHLEFWQLPHPLSELAWAVWELAPHEEELRAQLARAEADADRVYAAMCARPAQSMTAFMTTFAEVSRLRGEPGRASRAERASRTRSGEAA